MSKKKTHEEYVEQVARVNPNIEVVGQYVNVNTKIEHRCKIDGNIWFAYPSNILTGHGCKECMKNNLRNRFAKTHDQYVQEVLDANPNIEVVGIYINSMTPILHKCKKHNVEWSAMPCHILDGAGCVMCKGEKIYNNKVKDIEVYKNEVTQLDKNIEVSGIYINARTPMLHTCKVCQCNWYATPDNILNGYGCPECNFSIGEKMVKDYLVKNNIEYDSQHKFNDCKNIYVLPFDFYLTDYNACIEYDGRQHFEPVEIFGGKIAFENTQKRDAIKTNYCLKNNIPLLRIRYDEDVTAALDNFLNFLTIQNYNERTS